jgi:perosamine synthetase
MEALKEAGVATRPFFYPLHKQPVLTGFPYRSPGTFPVSEMLGSQGFYLPNGLGMSEKMLDESVSISSSVLGGPK